MTAEQNSALDAMIGYNLKRANTIAESQIRRCLANIGLAPREFSALALAVEIPNITQSTLARHLGVERSGLVSTIDALEQRALLNRVAVPGDRRIQALIATAKGIAAHQEALCAIQMQEEQLTQVLSATEIDSLRAVLQKIRKFEEGKTP
ncbi:hypothetical protein GCM10007939_11270 [Amylibacter marinus]|uniref:HTH marR-type domain-containing protein n=1 Tax=Amylibacter marinus TaxID=1475483 RepID=A0ABQ5VUK7_9RHOB|nr:MarR family transcriptional regulator [Amylibacter marinus]GLQ34844.1 hypothetical protein GCM10007939_11270 [Amylibacter marinus]